MDKECLECGKKYKVPKCRYEKSKYCSFDCRVKSQSTNKNQLRKRKITDCKNCGIKFEQPNYLNGEYCSRDCYWKYRRGNPQIKFQSNQGINLIEKKCLNCGHPYNINKYRDKTSKYCSITCHDDYRRNSIVCPTCKIIFSAPKYQNRKYCSQECFSKGVDKRKSNFSVDVYNFLKPLYNIEDEFLLNGDDYKYFADIILNDYGIIIECNGDYWHCNPKIYSENYYHKQIRLTASEIWEKDLTKSEKFNILGYKVITLWEYDWNNNFNFFDNLKNSIENEIHKNKGN